MRTLRMNVLGLMTLVLILAVSDTPNASAGIRVKASVRTPHVGVHIDTGPAGQYRHHRHGPLPVRRDGFHRAERRDRKIARRLAWYTGTSSRELVGLKRQGYCWTEIGRWLEVPRPVIRAAMNTRSWDRFLRQQSRLARCGTRPDPHRRIISYRQCKHDRW